jgi:2,3-bisphosphoglycerate-independent phosphoglycerate mutase
VDADWPFADLHDVGQQAGAGASGQPTADLLAVGAGGQQHTRGRGGLDQRGQHVHVRSDEVVLRVVGLGDVDLGGASLFQCVGQRRSGARLAHHNGGGLAQLAGRGDQFGGDLLHRAIGVLDEHKYFSHVSMSFAV